MNNIVESIEIVAAFSSRNRGCYSFCYITQYFTRSEAVIKLKYLPLFLTIP